MAKIKTRRSLVSRASNFGASLLSELETLGIFSSLASTPELLNKGLIRGILSIGTPVFVTITEMSNGERIAVPDRESTHRFSNGTKCMYSIYNFSKNPVSIINKKEFIVSSYMGEEDTPVLYSSIPVPIYFMDNGIKMRDIFFISNSTVSGLFHG